MEVFIVAVVLLSLGFAGIAIKIWAKKDGEFSGTCASNSPFLNESGESCSFCGAAPKDQCRREEKETSAQSA